MKEKKSRRVLIVVLQRLGDVFLSTPIAKSLRKAYPDIKIDYMVAEGTQVILEHNGDVINDIIVYDRTSGIAKNFPAIKNIFRKYDVVFSTQGGDRSAIIALMAARKRAMIIPREGFSKTFWKKYFSTLWVYDDDSVSVVENNLSLLRIENIDPVCEFVVPNVTDLKHKNGFSIAQPYAVIQPVAKFRYKEWTISGWSDVISYLLNGGLNVVISGGSDPREKKICNELMNINYGSARNVVDISGKLEFSELSKILEQASLYVGVDTSVTHLASAIGLPVIAIFGPTSPEKWGPWPKNGKQGSFKYKKYASDAQQYKNVTLIQGKNDLGCVPCGQEGCFRKVESESLCLHGLTSDQVIKKISSILNEIKIEW